MSKPFRVGDWVKLKDGFVIKNIERKKSYKIEKIDENSFGSQFNIIYINGCSIGALFITHSNMREEKLKRILEIDD